MQETGSGRRNEKTSRIQEAEFRSQNPGNRIRGPAKTFEDLIVWQKAHSLALNIYTLTQTFPSAEAFGLTSQMRRAGISEPANVAEGFKKRGKADKVRFLNIAQGSLEEVRYYLILAKDLGYGDSSFCLTRVEEVSKLLERYSSSILASES